MSSILELKSKFRNIAAPNKFRVEIVPPTFMGGAAGAIKDKLSFFCKTAMIPAQRVGEIQIGYMGQKLKIAGDREYDDWTISVYNTEEWDIRTAFEIWLDLINNFQGNVKTEHNSYMTDLKVYQISAEGIDIAGYLLKDAWIKEIGEVSLDWDSNDEISTFDCTFAVNYLERI